MFKQKDVAALYIGSHTVIVLIGGKTESGVFRVSGRGLAFYDGYMQGEWLSEDSLFSAAERALSIAEGEAGCRVKFLYVGVPAEFSAVQCKSVTLNFGRSFRVSDEEINRLFEKGDTYGDNPDFECVNCSAVYYALGRGSVKRIIEPRGLETRELTGLISYVLAERRFRRLLEEFANRLHIKNLEFISVQWAEIMSLFEPAQRDRYVVLADVGYMSSSVTVARGDGALSLASFSVGGAHIAADINEVLKIPYTAAEDLKEDVDLYRVFSESDAYESRGGVKAPADIVNEIARARVENIADLINSALDAAEYKCPPYAPLYLTGSGLSYMRGACEVLNGKLQRTVEVISPSAPGLSGPKYSGAVSLLDMASGFKNAKSMFDGFFKLKRK
jgi:cell division protein FtsA